MRKLSTIIAAIGLQIAGCTGMKYDQTTGPSPHLYETSIHQVEIINHKGSTTLTIHKGEEYTFTFKDIDNDGKADWASTPRGAYKVKGTSNDLQNETQRLWDIFIKAANEGKMRRTGQFQENKQ